MCTAWWNITTWNHSCNHLPDRKLCQHSEAPSFPSQWLLLLSFWKETIVLASNIIDEFYLFLNFFFLAVQSSLQDLSSLTRDWTDLSSLTRDWTQQRRVLTTGPPGNSLKMLFKSLNPCCIMTVAVEEALNKSLHELYQWWGGTKAKMCSLPPSCLHRLCGQVIHHILLWSFLTPKSRWLELIIGVWACGNLFYSDICLRSWFWKHAKVVS